MKRAEEFICEFERRHPWIFGLLIAIAVVLLYAAVDDSTAFFALTGRPS